MKESSYWTETRIRNLLGLANSGGITEDAHQLDLSIFE